MHQIITFKRTPSTARNERTSPRSVHGWVLMLCVVTYLHAWSNRARTFTYGRTKACIHSTHMQLCPTLTPTLPTSTFVSQLLSHLTIHLHHSLVSSSSRVYMLWVVDVLCSYWSPTLLWWYIHRLSWYIASSCAVALCFLPDDATPLNWASTRGPLMDYLFQMYHLPHPPYLPPIGPLEYPPTPGLHDDLLNGTNWKYRTAVSVNDFFVNLKSNFTAIFED